MDDGKVQVLRGAALCVRHDAKGVRVGACCRESGQKSSLIKYNAGQKKQFRKFFVGTPNFESK